MKHLGTVIGTAIAGIFVMSVWGAFASAYGIAGGWFAGLLIIGTMWFLNHALGLINNDGAFVDMAVGIGMAGTMRDVFMNGGQVFVDALPTLVVVLVGGIVGGFAASKFEKYLASK
ncbi:hypothetical protein [Proteiniborus sp. MB09-C3]|uniref:Lin0368 family putative glycerol transporter subunit n=1 Tax=Proteiniborus sp. MB09-C3 TaxID=3050072 RepID=UPI002557992D|nr:hypothetical protein [Proteiniborus sp. MB09-C3]WIV12675.1 hypothetical protein QO263_02885 [Proteiniborus sp. MB09-C3]